MRKALVAAAVMLAAGLVLAAGRPGVLKTKDGSIYDGTVDEKDDGTVLVNVKGIETNVPRDRIDSITYGDFETRWNDEYAKLPKTEVKKRIELSRRAFDERKYALAEKAARDAQEIEPNNTEAADLLKLIINQRRLEKGSTESGGPTTPANPNANKPTIWKTLSNEQINRIRQVELAGADSKVRFSFKNNVVRKYFDSNPGLNTTFPEFNKREQLDKATQIIKNGGELAKDVEVTNDPNAMLVFKRDVQPLVLQGCATSACHGGNNESTKQFVLITPAPDNAAAYSNFYTLQAYTKTMPIKDAEGLFNPGKSEMINRTQADMSMLLQYALPEQSAEIKHPHVRGYNGIVRSKEDPKYKTIQAFITSLNPSPEYGFSFTLQRQTPETTAPTTSPVKELIDGAKKLVK